MECFRIDESGYTGFDLLNAEQRFQGATAVAIDDNDAARLIAAHFPKLQAPELKFRALSRRPANHSRLIGLMRDVLASYKCATFVCDKRFLLALMFVDYAVEPFYHAQGIDFYADGRNYALASLLHSTAPTLLGKGAYRRILAAFQQAMKDKTPERLDALIRAVHACDWEQFDEALGPLAVGAPECLQAILTRGVSTDIAMIVLQSLISRMEEMAAGPYRVEHDQSKNLATYHDLIRRLADHKEAAEFRMSAAARVRFPLQLTQLIQVDSRTSPAVQIADILIGAVIEAGNTLAGVRSAGLDPRAILSLYAEDQLIHLLPSIDFAEQREFRAGTQAAGLINYYSANFASE
ncbi:hypothetical protein V475_22525 [Sphingobium baderi LL03]|uniref:DUF3800 domain-containing protein n=3 Tax=Sphingomonadaceae TaxID=41297 RepID=T0I4X2_9SPHN|nr:hypothetical protein L485_03585 [Sphingobium baderi LL03]KKW90520.1 hypothetical protein YP76_18120 [Sphingobium chungbukense]KMS51286.1 hypothetical protein V475_22525 [Sphingobium baderi LL03]